MRFTLQENSAVILHMINRMNDNNMEDTRIVTHRLA